jgi:non-canonical purine NTP pyrophosphatase (RdgB/HAM1 family)
MRVRPRIYFVTSNAKKFSSLKERLSSINVDLQQLQYDFDEGRSLDIKKVAQYKLDQAKKAFPNKKIIVDDRGFFIPALNGFPGPFVKLLLSSFSYKGLIKLMAEERDRRAIFSYAIAYFDGHTNTVIVANEEGFITDAARGDNLHGWTEILYVYGHPSFPKRSLAELNDQEWLRYLKYIEDIDVFMSLKKHLEAHI